MSNSSFTVPLLEPDAQQSDAAYTTNPESEKQEIPPSEPVPAKEGKKSFAQKVKAIPIGVRRAIHDELSGEHWSKAADDFKQHVLSPVKNNTLKVLYWMGNKWDKVVGKQSSSPPAETN